MAAAGVAVDGGSRARENGPMNTLATLLALLALSTTPGAARAAPGPATFPSAREAAGALVTAAGADDVKALLALFGPDGKALVESGDPVQDRNDRASFVALAHERLEVVPDPKDPARALLVVGPDGWPFPVPLVERSGAWSFSARGGLREVVDRRVGANELDAIEICRGYVEAQQAYGERDLDGDGVHEYAQRVVSTDGKRDGLAWRNADGTLGGPISEAVARAIAEGYKDRAQPFHGYHFRILKKQGGHARLGALDYVIQGRMIGGFALLAWPAAYRSSGVKTFIVSHDGVVYEKDLGPDTAKLAGKMDRFDPGPGWTPVP